MCWGWCGQGDEAGGCAGAAACAVPAVRARVWGVWQPATAAGASSPSPLPKEVLQATTTRALRWPAGRPRLAAAAAATLCVGACLECTVQRHIAAWKKKKKKGGVVGPPGPGPLPPDPSVRDHTGWACPWCVQCGGGMVATPLRTFTSVDWSTQTPTPSTYLLAENCIGRIHVQIT